MAEKTDKNYFQILNEINVSGKIEKKNNLSYLSWAYAWGEVKILYPEASYKVYETEAGCIYWHDGRTAWVKTGVTINNQEHIEYLPVMDYNNKSILVDKVTSFDVNKAIQRSLTKAIARHGLGLYIYAGEDLPTTDVLGDSEESISPNSGNLKYFKTARARNDKWKEVKTKIETFTDYESLAKYEDEVREVCRQIYLSDNESGLALRDAFDTKAKALKGDDPEEFLDDSLEGVFDDDKANR